MNQKERLKLTASMATFELRFNIAAAIVLIAAIAFLLAVATFK